MRPFLVSYLPTSTVMTSVLISTIASLLILRDRRWSMEGKSEWFCAHLRTACSLLDSELALTYSSILGPSYSRVEIVATEWHCRPTRMCGRTQCGSPSHLWAMDEQKNAAERRLLRKDGLGPWSAENPFPSFPKGSPLVPILCYYIRNSLTVTLIPRSFIVEV
jgi:hypothetical protein